jgi:ATP-binding cassette subfamily C protein
LAVLAMLSAFGVAAESMGLLLLVPLLGVLGVDSGGSPIAVPLLPKLDLEAVLAIYVVLVVLGACLIGGRTLLARQIRRDFERELALDLHKIALDLPWPAFQRLRVADLYDLIHTGSRRCGLVVETWITTVDILLRGLTLVSLCVFLSPEMTVISLAVGITIVLAGAFMFRDAAKGDMPGDHWRHLSRVLNDDLTGMRIIKAMNAQTARQTLFADHLIRQLDHDYAHHRTQARQRLVGQAVAAILAAMILVLAVRGFGNELSRALVLIVIFARLSQTGSRVHESLDRVRLFLPSFRTCEQLLSQAREVEHDEADAALGQSRCALRLDNISVRYQGASRPALDSIQLSVTPGTALAVIGPSGAGKSTLADMLAGLIGPDDGQMVLGDLVIGPDMRRAYRNLVAYVPQEPFLIHDSIRANLCLGLPLGRSASDDAIWSALQRVAAADFVRHLPSGLDTLVGDRGTFLSGGERQRLALARAILRKPRLLVLDEATSGLDPATERMVLGGVLSLRPEVTIIVIAHRPSGILGVDHIVQLDRGRILATDAD